MAIVEGSANATPVGGWSSPTTPANGVAGEPRLVVELVPTLLTALLAALVLWDASFPARLWFAAVFGGFLGLFVFVDWMVVIIDRARRGWPVSRRRKFALIGSLPVIVALTGLLYFSPIPSHVRFALSRAALEALIPADAGDPSGTTVRLYDVEDFERAPWGFEFWTNSSLLLDCGLAYIPAGRPGSSVDHGTFAGEHGYEQVDGPWYVWCQEWD